MQTGIEAIAASLGSSAAPAGMESVGASAAPGGFANVFQRQVNELNDSVSAAETAMSKLAAGKPVELHELMISLERAHFSVQMFVQLRNKLVESYQDLTRMQI